MGNVKEEMKVLVRDALNAKASSIFLNRALAKIEDSGSDRHSLALASEGVGRLVALFIDEDLAADLKQVLVARLDRGKES